MSQRELAEGFKQDTRGGGKKPDLVRADGPPCVGCGHRLQEHVYGGGCSGPNCDCVYYAPAKV